MNITFEMIEKVLDATGADYYTAKETLLANDGNVEEAIKAIGEMKTDEATADLNDDTDGATADTKEDNGESAADAKDDNDVAAEDAQKGDGEAAADAKDEKEKDPFLDFFSEEQAKQRLNRLKEKVEAGNVDRIKVTKDGKTLFDIPLNAGLVGGLVGLIIVPWAVILGVLIAYGMDCKIEIIKSDGKSESL